ncbi:hypothetical protein ACFX13_000670 [Malus domestica]
MMKISNEDPADGNIKLSFRRGYYLGDLPTTINSATTSTDAEDSDQTEEKKNEENIPRTNLIFVIACMVAISMDPLFLYIPIIDGESKCLGVDKKLRIVTLLFRSLIDITYIVHITYQIRQAIKSALPEDQSHPNEQTVTSSTWKSKFFDLFERRDKTFEFSWTSIIIDVLAVLPIPQVLLGAVYFKMGGSRYLDCCAKIAPNPLEPTQANPQEIYQMKMQEQNIKDTKILTRFLNSQCNWSTSSEQ